MPGIQPHRHGAARPHAVDAAGGALDVGRIDVAARHDDDVLEPAAHHDIARLGEVAEIARVVPAVVVLGRDEPAAVVYPSVTGSPRTSMTPTPRAGSTAPSTSMMRASSPFSRRPSEANRRVSPVVAGTARRRTASRSASTSSTSRPVPHSVKTTPRRSSRPCRRRAGSPPDANPNGAPASHNSATSAGSTCSAPDSAHRSDDRSNWPGVACLRSRLAKRL